MPNGEPPGGRYSLLCWRADRRWDRLYWSAPMVAWYAACLGAIIGYILAIPLDGNFFSNVVMRAMDIILSFPSYLLAIAIVAFLGPVWRKG